MNALSTTPPQRYRGFLSRAPPLLFQFTSAGAAPVSISPAAMLSSLPSVLPPPKAKRNPAPATPAYPERLGDMGLTEVQVRSPPLPTRPASTSVEPTPAP